MYVDTENVQIKLHKYACYNASMLSLNCIIVAHQRKLVICFISVHKHESKEPQSQKTYLQVCAPSKDSDQPTHSRSPIRIFTWFILDSQGCKDDLHFLAHHSFKYTCYARQLSVHTSHKHNFSDLR